MEVFEYRIIKIEKGAFFIEYKTARFDSWKEIDKQFKTYTKAENWITCISVCLDILNKPSFRSL